MPKPKRVTTYRTCPECGDRSTKIFNISVTEKPVKCQACGHRYDPPPPSVRRPRRILQSNRDWFFT
jgi:rubredoxin